jgi:hypothetical protein
MFILWSGCPRISYLTKCEVGGRVLNDPSFADRLISFLESVLTNAIDNALDDNDSESSLFQSAPHFSPDRSDEGPSYRESHYCQQSTNALARS